MSERRYFWIKLPKNFFYDKAIKKLRRIAGGDTFTIIYLKMLLASSENNGKLYFEGIEDDIYEEIALEIDEDPENVRVTINYLVSAGLAEISPDEIMLNKLPEMVGSETSMAIRKRRSRQKLPKKCDNVTALSQCVTSVSQGVTTCHTEIEIEIDKEKEKEIDKDAEIDNTSIASEEAKSDFSCNVKQIVDSWNELSQYGIRKVLKIDPQSTRYKNLVARIKEFGIDEILEMIKKIPESDWLCGRKAEWQITFDWFVNKTNMTKVYEGNYVDVKKKRLDNRTLEQKEQDAEVMAILRGDYD